MRRRLIGVAPASGLRRWTNLFEALARRFPVDFREWDSAQGRGLDALLLLERGTKAAIPAVPADLPIYMVMNEARPQFHSGSGKVDFTSCSVVAPCFRNQALWEADVQDFAPLALEPSDEVVARKGGEVVWSYRSRGSSGVDLVSLAPPESLDRSLLVEHLRPGQFLRLLPLFNFLRRLTANEWKPPPPRACFMFDDANLHWRRYGFIDYAAMARHAALHNYHAAFSTVPLDAWRVHDPTATLFREHASRLSLLIHGNNHTKQELARSRSKENSLLFFAQALRRIEALERRSGLIVARVVSPPHSACAQDAFGTMLRLGYEAVCVSWSELIRYNDVSRFPADMGTDMTELFGRGFPVIPRIKLLPDCTTQVLLALFLDQPIIIYGHHYDAADGLVTLAEVAECVNKLGGVHWTDMKSIAESNYITRTEGDRLRVKMYARRVCLRLPERVSAFRVERPWIQEGEDGEVLACQAAGTNLASALWGGITPWIQAPPGSSIVISSVPVKAVDHAKIPSPGINLWAVMRRILTESRDQMLPMISSKYGSKTRRRLVEPN